MTRSSSVTIGAFAAAAALLTGCGTGGAGTGAVPSLPPLTAAAPTSDAASTPVTTPTPSSAPSTPSPSSSPSSSGSASPQAPSPAPTRSPDGMLRPGDKGPAVLALQRQLLALGYWLSGADGAYGVTTQQAVLALQKAAGTGRDGIAGPQTMAALAQHVTPHPRSTTGHVLEVDKAHQLLLIVTNGHVDQTIATSTGSYAPYTQQGQQYIASTPDGHFTIFRQVDGVDPGPLGALYRPKYFNAGIAVHGYQDVPAEAASHGCARVSDAAIDYLWNSNTAPIGTPVWVY